MRVIDIENINFAMRNEIQFILRCEEVFHDRISATAAVVLSEKSAKPLVALSGPSGSGKTTTAMRLRDYLQNLGASVLLISMDDFFLSQDARPPEIAENWESPYCVNVDLLVACIERLLDGQAVDVPKYNFKTGRSEGAVRLQGDPSAIIIAEGIHMLNPLIFDRIRTTANGIYVAPRTRIITNDDQIVRPAQMRVARRLIRDYNTRGHSLRDIVLRAQSVDQGEQDFIVPYKQNATIHIDSFHDYEPCILAKYLRETPGFSEDLTREFMAENGLSVLMDVVYSIPPLHSQYVPRDSIVREFVGGSRYQY